MLNAERAERDQLAQEVLALRANADETARVAQQLITAELNPPAAPGMPAPELDALRRHASELQFKLKEAERLYRIMSDTLDGMGIRIDLPIVPRDGVKTGH